MQAGYQLTTVLFLFFGALVRLGINTLNLYIGHYRKQKLSTKKLAQILQKWNSIEPKRKLGQASITFAQILGCRREKREWGGGLPKRSYILGLYFGSYLHDLALSHARYGQGDTLGGLHILAHRVQGHHVQGQALDIGYQPPRPRPAAHNCPLLG